MRTSIYFPKKIIYIVIIEKLFPSFYFMTECFLLYVLFGAIFRFQALAGSFTQWWTGGRHVHERIQKVRAGPRQRGVSVYAARLGVYELRVRGIGRSRYALHVHGEWCDSLPWWQHARYHLRRVLLRALLWRRARTYFCLQTLWHQCFCLFLKQYCTLNSV